MSLAPVTVALCTYRRAGLLPQTLASLAAVARPGVQWDVLVVDNGCEDAVAQVVAGFRGKLPIRYEREPEVGVARARNRAIAAAAGPVVLFADDDVRFDRHWLVNMVRAVAEHPECDFWGGRIQEVWEVPRPAWFDMERCPSLGDSVVRYDAGSTPRPWDPARDPPFYTCNLGLRVDAVRQAGLFDVSLGHSGAKRGTGEDSWMIKTIHRQGGRGWYAADALLHHPVEAKRLTKAYARRFAWRQGRVAVEMLRREQAAAGRKRLPRWLYRYAGGQVLGGLGRAAAGLGRLDSGLAFAGQYTMIFNTSKLWHALRG